MLPIHNCGVFLPTLLESECAVCLLKQENNKEIIPSDFSSPGFKWLTVSLDCFGLLVIGIQLPCCGRVQPVVWKGGTNI